MISTNGCNMNNLSFPKIMGILNITEDSFSDGGIYFSHESALERAREMIQQGADLIDIGAESTRPGAAMISAEVEWQRIKPVLKAIKQEYPEMEISIDTQKSYVAALAIEHQADIINDISALTWDPGMALILRQNPHIKLILMHMQGRPETMQLNPHYEDVVSEILTFLRARISFATDQGINPANLIVDPGIGFDKTLQHNLDILHHLEQFKQLGCPLVLGASRKIFINMLCPSTPADRLGGSLAAATIACLNQVDYIRVHDVFAHRQFLEVLKAIYKGGDA